MCMNICHAILIKVFSDLSSKVMSILRQGKLCMFREGLSQFPNQICKLNSHSDYANYMYGLPIQIRQISSILKLPDFTETGFFDSI